VYALPGQLAGRRRLTPERDNPIDLARDPDQLLRADERSEDGVVRGDANRGDPMVVARVRKGIGPQPLRNAGDMRLPGQPYGSVSTTFPRRARTSGGKKKKLARRMKVCARKGAGAGDPGEQESYAALAATTLRKARRTSRAHAPVGQKTCTASS